MKKILLIPTTYYLSNDFFGQLVNNLQDNYEYVYLDPNEKGFEKFNGYNKFLDDYANKVNCIEVPKEKFNFSNLILKTISFHFYAFRFKRIINRINPDLIITTSDGTQSVRILDRSCDKKIIVVQTTFLNFDEEKYKNKRSILKEKIYNLFESFLYPYMAPSQVFGLKNQRHELFVWGDRVRSYYSGKKDLGNIHVVGNPNVTSLVKRTSNKRVGFLIADCKDRELQDVYLREAIDLQKKLDGKIDIIIRPHPSLFADSRYNDLIAEAKYLSTTEEDIEEFVENSKLIVSPFSSITLTSLAKRVPVIHYRKEKLTSFEFWFKGSNIDYYSSINDLESFLLNLSEEKLSDIVDRNKEYLESIWFKTDAESIKLISKKIREITSS